MAWSINKLYFFISLLNISVILDIKAVHYLLLLLHIILLFICVTLQYKCLKKGRIIEESHEPEIKQYLFTLASDCLRNFLDKRFVLDKLNSQTYFNSWTVVSNQTKTMAKHRGWKGGTQLCSTAVGCCLYICLLSTATRPLYLYPASKWVLGRLPPVYLSLLIQNMTT